MHLKLIIILLLTILFFPFPPAKAIPNNLDLARLHDQIFRLKKGAINRCPEKVGFIVPNISEVKIYPMEIEWKKINQQVHPLVELKAIRNSIDPPKVEKIRVGGIETSYSAEWNGSNISAENTTNVEGEIISNHTRIDLASRHKIAITRWIKTFSGPLGEGVRCEYTTEKSLPTATQVVAIRHKK